MFSPIESLNYSSNRKWRSKPRSRISFSYNCFQRLRSRSLRSWLRGSALNLEGCGLSGGKRRPISYPASDRCLGSLSASVNDRTTRRTAETVGAATLVIPCSRSFDHAGCSFQILLVSREPGEGLQWAKDYWACAKRRPFTEAPTPLCTTPAGPNPHLLTAGEKP